MNLFVRIKISRMLHDMGYTPFQIADICSIMVTSETKDKALAELEKKGFYPKEAKLLYKTIKPYLKKHSDIGHTWNK
jgi:hypothetical protein